VTTRTISRRTTALGGIFGLLADRDPEALADQSCEITLGGVIGHAGHRDGLAIVTSAKGLRDAENCGGLDRIVKEQLVEIAHPEEDHRIGMRLLHLQILRHERRCALGRGRRGRRRGHIFVRGGGFRPLHA
jgi:hypothetical protein